MLRQRRGRHGRGDGDATRGGNRTNLDTGLLKVHSEHTAEQHQGGEEDPQEQYSVDTTEICIIQDGRPDKTHVCRELIQQGATLGHRSIPIECVGQVVARFVQHLLRSTGVVNRENGHKRKVHERGQNDPPGIRNETGTQIEGVSE